jgi:hypothetical protein
MVLALAFTNTILQSKKGVLRGVLSMNFGTPIDGLKSARFCKIAGIIKGQSRCVAHDRR